MIQRPKLGETEEDLLRQEEEFLKSSGKQPPLKRKTEENELQTAKQFEILGDIKEKASGTFKPVEWNIGETKGFPKSFKVDSTVVQKKRGKRSLFALQLEKNRKTADEEMEIEELSTFNSQGLDNESNSSKVKNEVHQENLQKLSKLSEEEIIEEQKKLLSTLDPKLIEFLKSRGKERQAESAVNLEVPEAIKVDEEEVKQNLEKYLDSRWVNMDFLEKEKLEWIGDIPDKKSLQPDQPYSARFDFKGELQPFSTEIDVRNSLYHHGEEPHRPGYTIQELYQLSRSQVFQQRNVALTTLARIIRKTKLGYYDRCFDGQMLHKLVESDLFFLLRFSIDENSLVPASIYCLHNLICNESDEFCLDKLLGVTHTDEQPLLFNKMEATEDEEKELRDHVVISCDLIKGVLRTDLLIRLAYVLSNFSQTRETVIRTINSLIRISRHSAEATTSVLRTPNLLNVVYNSIKNDTPVYEGLKLFRILITYSKEAAREIIQSYDFRFVFSFIEAEENPNISKKEFYLLKLEALYFCRGVLLSFDEFTEEFVTWTPSLIRLLLFYTEKVNVTAENDFDFELFSAMTSVVIVCNRKKIAVNPNVHVMLQICLEKWLKQLIQRREYNFAVSKALGCACRYFTSYYKTFGVNAPDFDFNKKINSILVSLFQSEAFDAISSALKRQSYVLCPTMVTRDPDNLPSLCSVYDGGGEFLRLVQNSSPLPFFISLVKYLKASYHVWHGARLAIKLFAESENIRKYISKVCQCNERVYNWFMKFETEFLSGVLKLLLLLDDGYGALRLGFRLISLLRVDDVKSKKVFGVLCDKKNWKVDENFLDELAPVCCELFVENRELGGVLNYKNNLIPEDWSYKVLALLRGKEAVRTVTNILKFISLILDKNPDFIKRVPYTFRFLNLCYTFLTDSNVFESEIQNELERIFGDVMANQDKVNLNMKFDKNKSFYDLYTELITQYAGVSYGLPLFAKLVLFPLQNRFNVSFRKLIWFEYSHVLRVIMLPFPAEGFVGLEGFVEPCETDESLLVAYLNSLSNNVITKVRNPFVYGIAVGNVSSFLRSTTRDEKLLAFLKRGVAQLKSEELKNDILNFSAKG